MGFDACSCHRYVAVRRHPIARRCDVCFRSALTFSPLFARLLRSVERQPSMPVPGSERSAAWEQSPSWASTPMNPAQREAHRVETTRKQLQQQRGGGADLAAKLSMYQARRTRAASLAPALDERKVLTDHRVQALLSPSGELPTLPSQQPDRGNSTTNILRFTRKTAVGIKCPADGGPLYSTTTLEGNWCEESRDRNYTSPWHPRELRLNKLWDTEYTGSFVMSHYPEYAQRTFQANLVAAVEPSIKLPQSPGSQRTDTLFAYGQDGFGDRKHQDHTSISKRGGHWLGISPVLDGKESVTTTVHGRRDYLEFQMRTATSDPKATFLGTHPGGTHRVLDAWGRAAQADLANGERYTKAWRSTYARDFQDHNLSLRRATTAVGGPRGAAGSLSLARPQTAGPA